MKLFIDSANIKEIEEAYATGVINGITTNPSLFKEALSELKKKGKKLDMKAYIKELLLIAKGSPVSLEVTKTDYEGMVDEAKTLFNEFNPGAGNVYIKIPINTSMKGKIRTFDGLKAIRELSQAGIPVNCTLIFTPEQALLAAKAGAKMVSPFTGRIDDYIRTSYGLDFEKSAYFPSEGTRKGDAHMQDNGIVSGVDLIAKCVQIFKQYNIRSEVLAASIRNPRQLREVALAGSHIATIPLEVLKQSLSHVKTVEGITKFIDDVPTDYAKLGR